MLGICIPGLGPLSMAQSTVVRWLLGLSEFVHIVCPCFFPRVVLSVEFFCVCVLDLLEFSFLFHNLSRLFFLGALLYPLLGRCASFDMEATSVPATMECLESSLISGSSCPSLAARIFCLLGADVLGSQAVDIPPLGVIFHYSYQILG